MKKLLGGVILLAVAQGAFAQFNVEFGASYNASTGSFSDTHDLGLGFYAEPSYSFGDFSVLAQMGWIAVDGKGSEAAIIASSNLTTYLVGAKYTFLNQKIRPFAGLLGGVYDTEFVEIDRGGSDIVVAVTPAKMGFSPALGLDFDRYSFSTQYHFIEEARFIQLKAGVRLFKR
ncbi:MAG: hypothetical protein Tsb0034_07590 [Ekhidna sp.]